MRDYIAKNVDEYIASAPKEAQAKMNELRAVIKSAVPKAEESIKRGVPFYMYHGMLSGFCFFTKHVTFWLGGPTIEEKDREMLAKKDYTTGKKTIQIKFDQKIPATFIKQMLQEQAKANEIKKAKKALKKTVK